jgi:hypothetical protein
LGIGLAAPPTTLRVGSVDFHHPDTFAVQAAGEAGAVAAGALDTDQFERTEAAQPPEQTAIARRGGLEGLHTQQATAVVQRGGDVHVEVGVDTSGDQQWHRGQSSSRQARSPLAS